MTSSKTKRCGRCKKRRPIAKFAEDKTRGLQSYCRDCNNAYRRERRAKDPIYKERSFRAARQTRKELKEEVIALKSDSPCKDCGRFWNWWQMHFDHIDGSNKEGNISRFVADGAREKLYAELPKCELVCANCHADRTYYRNNADLVQ